MDQSRYRKLLEKVSRSFSLSLFGLPRQQRSFVSDCYLLARIADTWADSGNLQAFDRIEALRNWEECLKRGRSWQPRRLPDGLKPAEVELLEESNFLLEGFHSYPEHQKEIARSLFTELFAGMRWFVNRFDQATQENPVYGISDQAEFDRYCYDHAGCVGRFWTRTFDLPAQMEEQAVAYGRGLERVNILRDVIEDRQAGRILLPKTWLDDAGFQTTEPWKEAQWNAFVADYTKETYSFFEKAIEYCNQIPFGRFRLRWASMMPLKIGLASLKLYESEENKTQLSKIRRRRVYAMACESLLDVVAHRRLSAGEGL